MRGKQSMTVVGAVGASCAGLVTASVLFFIPPEAKAALLAIDANPSRFGIQSKTKANLGTTFEIDVVVSDIGVADPLNAFEFDLDFDAAILTAVSIVSGGFLDPPSLIVEEDITPPDVNFAEFTLGSAGAVGSGVLATVQFSADALGVSSLDLNDVILSAPFGVEIAEVEIIDGAVKVAEPPAAVYLVPALLAVAWFTRRVGRRAGEGYSLS